MFRPQPNRVAKKNPTIHTVQIIWDPFVAMSNFDHLLTTNRRRYRKRALSLMKPLAGIMRSHIIQRSYIDLVNPCVMIGILRNRRTSLTS